MRSSSAIQARRVASLAAASNGWLSRAVMRPAVSVTARGMPSRRTSSARASSASAAAPSRGSFNPAKTWPRSRLVSRASLPRWRATIQAYPTESTPNSSAAAMSAGGPARRSAPLGNAVSADIRHQRRRDGDGAVGLLVGFEQRRDRARQRNTRRVQRVHEFGLLAGPRAGANVRAPGLIVGVGAGARDLEPLADAGRPCLEVVGLGGREAEVVRGQHRDAIGQLQLLEHGLCMQCELFMLRRRIGGEAEPDELDFIELMNAEQPARVFPRGPGLTPETRSVGDITFGQRRPVQNLVPVEVRDRYLRGRDEEQVVRHGPI